MPAVGLAANPTTALQREDCWDITALTRAATAFAAVITLAAAVITTIAALLG
jgi:hypothetical protein